MPLKWRGVRRVPAEPLVDQYQPAYKPGSVGPCPRCRGQDVTAIPLGQRLRVASSNLPGRRAWHRSRRRFRFRERPASPSLFGLAPGVVCPAGSVAGPAVRSYRTFSPLPRFTPCGASPGGSFSVALSLGLPPPDVIRHRMSMEPGLSSPLRGAAARPT